MIQNKSTFLLDAWFGGGDLQVSSETHLNQVILEFYLRDPNQVASKIVDLNALLCRCQHWNFEVPDLSFSIEICRDSGEKGCVVDVYCWKSQAEIYDMLSKPRI